MVNKKVSLIFWFCKPVIEARQNALSPGILNGFDGISMSPQIQAEKAFKG